MMTDNFTDNFFSISWKNHLILVCKLHKGRWSEKCQLNIQQKYLDLNFDIDFILLKFIII